MDEETTQKCVEFVKNGECRGEHGRRTALSRFFRFCSQDADGRNCRYVRHFQNGRVDKLRCGGGSSAQEMQKKSAASEYVLDNVAEKLTER